jgi:hypothetical protein
MGYVIHTSRTEELRSCEGPRTTVLAGESCRSRIEVTSVDSTGMDQARQNPRYPGGKRSAETERLAGKADERLLVLYGRVSGQGQKGELDTQLARLQAWAESSRMGQDTLVLSDSGSGLSATRRHLQRLLTWVREGRVAESSRNRGGVL